MTRIKFAVFASALVSASAAFAQQTPPAKPITQGTQPATTPQQPASAATRGGMSAGAGQTAAGGAAAGAVTTEGLIGVGAALVVTTGLAASTNKH